MFCFRSVSRLIAATTLVISSVALLTVVSNSSAGAANAVLTFNCGSSYVEPTVNNSETVTITVGTSCTAVNFSGINGAPVEGSATLNGTTPMVGSQLTSVSQGDTIIYTAPASGSGTDAFTFSSGQNPGNGVVISFPSPSGTLTDNGDGTMTVTYAGSVLGYLLQSGSTCADPFASLPSSTQFIFTPLGPAGASLAASPAVIEVGTTLFKPGGPQPAPVTAGSYQACLYSGGQVGALLSSLAVTIGEVVPTTTVPAGDPVVPAFTG